MASQSVDPRPAENVKTSPEKNSYFLRVKKFRGRQSSTANPAGIHTRPTTASRQSDYGTITDKKTKSAAAIADQITERKLVSSHQEYRPITGAATMTASQVITLRIPPGEVAEIDNLAAAAGITRAAWILAAIRQQLPGETGTTPAEIETRLAAVEAQLAELVERMPDRAPQSHAAPRREPERTNAPPPAGNPDTAPLSEPPAPRYRPGKHASDPNAIARLLELAQQQMSNRQIASMLDAEGYRTATGQRWKWQSVRDTKSREGKK